MPDHRFPYGDAFIIGTPHIDQLSNQLYQDQQKRELYKQQQEKALNDEFKNMLPGVRAPDVGKLADLWGDYKNSWIQLQRYPPKNQTDYLNSQRNLMMKLAQVQQHVAGSKEKGQEEKGMGNAIIADKTGRLVDDAHNILKQGMNLPYDQPLMITEKDGQQKQIDTTDISGYLRHIDTKGVMKAIKEAQGDRNTEYIGDKGKATDLQMPKIKGGNNPSDFYNNLLLPATADQTNFLNTLPHPNEDEYNDKLIQWDNLDPSIKKMWKMKGDLPSEDEIKTPIQRAMKYQAMTYGLNPNNQPRVVGMVDDKALMEANKQQFQKEQQKRGADFAMQRVMALLNTKRSLDNEDDLKGIAGILNNTKEIIESGIPQKDPVGNDDKSVVDISDFNLLKAFSNIKGYNPDNVTFDKKKEQFNVIYYPKSYTDNNGVHSKPLEIVPVSVRDYLRLKVDEMNPKNKGKTNANIDKIITESGGLLPALDKVFKPDAVNQHHTKITESKTIRKPLSSFIK